MSETLCFHLHASEVSPLDPLQLPEGPTALDGRAIELILDYVSEDVFTEPLPSGLGRWQKQQACKATQQRLRELHPDALINVATGAGSHLLCSVLEPDQRLSAFMAWLCSRRCRVTRVTPLGSLPLAKHLRQGDLLHLDRYDTRHCRFRLYRDADLIHQRSVPLSEDMAWAEICTALRETVAYFRESGVLGERPPALLYTGPIRGGSALLTHLRQRYAMTLHRLGELSAYLQTLPMSVRSTRRYQQPAIWRTQQHSLTTAFYLPRASVIAGVLLFLVSAVTFRQYQLTADAHALWQRNSLTEASQELTTDPVDSAALLQYWHRHRTSDALTLVMSVGYLLAEHDEVTLHHVRWRRGMDDLPDSLQASLALTGLGAFSESTQIQTKMQGWLTQHFTGLARFELEQPTSARLSGTLAGPQADVPAFENHSMTLILEAAHES